MRDKPTKIKSLKYNELSNLANAGKIRSSANLDTTMLEPWQITDHIIQMCQTQKDSSWVGN